MSAIRHPSSPGIMCRCRPETRGAVYPQGGATPAPQRKWRPPPGVGTGPQPPPPPAKGASAVRPRSHPAALPTQRLPGRRPPLSTALLTAPSGSISPSSPPPPTQTPARCRHASRSRPTSTGRERPATGRGRHSPAASAAGRGRAGAGVGDRGGMAGEGHTSLPPPSTVPHPQGRHLPAEGAAGPTLPATPQPPPGNPRRSPRLPLPLQNPCGKRAAGAASSLFPLPAFPGTCWRPQPPPAPPEGPGACRPPCPGRRPPPLAFGLVRPPYPWPLPACSCRVTGEPSQEE